MAATYVPGPNGPIVVSTSSGASTTTWNSADKASITLSGGDLIATKTGADADAQVRSVASRSSGKVHFEATFTTVITNSSSMGLGIASASHTLGGGSYVGSDLTSVGVWGDKSVYLNGSATTLLSTNPAQGDVMAIEVDFGAALLWVKTSSSTNWNNNGSADPATGTGGFNISTLTSSPWYIICDAEQTNQAWTLNAGGSAYAFTPSSGYGNW
jgi:hypothetical protein